MISITCKEEMQSFTKIENWTVRSPAASVCAGGDRTLLIEHHCGPKLIAG